MWCGVVHGDLSLHMLYNRYMTSLPNQEDRGIESDVHDPQNLDQDNDGVIEDGLGNPAAPEDDSGT